MHGVARPQSEDDVRRTLRYARSQGLSVSIGGTRHSMGGQSSFPGGLVLDMRDIDTVVVNEATATTRVGANWQARAYQLGRLTRERRCLRGTISVGDCVFPPQPRVATA